MNVDLVKDYCHILNAPESHIMDSNIMTLTYYKKTVTQKSWFTPHKNILNVLT